MRRVTEHRSHTYGVPGEGAVIAAPRSAHLRFRNSYIRLER